MKVAAIVPAYNEADRISAVLSVLTQIPTINEVIAVSDGSTDGTYQIASSISGVRAIQLPKNVGKGGAMHAGALQTDAEILIFLDADLIGLKSQHVEDILAPVLSGEAQMSVGVFRGGRIITDLAQIFFPYVSGQRAIRRDLFLKIPCLEEVRSGIEMAITTFVKSQGVPIKDVIITGVTHPMKEQKLGFWQGAKARYRMYAEMLRFMLGGKHPSEKITDRETTR